MQDDIAASRLENKRQMAAMEDAQRAQNDSAGQQKDWQVEFDAAIAADLSKEEGLDQDSILQALQLEVDAQAQISEEDELVWLLTNESRNLDSVQIEQKVRDLTGQQSVFNSRSEVPAGHESSRPRIELSSSLDDGLATRAPRLNLSNSLDSNVSGVLQSRQNQSSVVVDNSAQANVASSSEDVAQIQHTNSLIHDVLTPPTPQPDLGLSSSLNRTLNLIQRHLQDQPLPSSSHMSESPGAEVLSRLQRLPSVEDAIIITPPNEASQSNLDLSKSLTSAIDLLQSYNKPLVSNSTPGSPSSEVVSRLQQSVSLEDAMILTPREVPHNLNVSTSLDTVMNLLQNRPLVNLQPPAIANNDVSAAQRSLLENRGDADVGQSQSSPLSNNSNEVNAQIDTQGEQLRRGLQSVKEVQQSHV